MTCLHQNIYWEDFFKPEKQNNYQYKFTDAYCLECSANKGREFAFRCQLWYLKKIGEWFDENLGRNYIYEYGPKGFNEFIKKNYPSFETSWQKLRSGKIDEEYFEGIFGQALFWEASRSVEKCCLEFKEEKEREKDNPPERERERERKIKSLKKRIAKLEAKSNRTAEEETELKEKKQELSQLEQENNQAPNNWIKPVLIGGGIVIAIGLIWLIIRSNKKKSY